ncbi:MAG: DUF4845 domain-containing protein [Pseudomonadales bacterium]|nr:DUF4845 domain-containing protein [Pseudomonadales bacterium]
MILKRQTGLSSLGMLLVVVLVVGGMLLAMKLIPLYIDDYAIGKALAALQEEETLYESPKFKIREALRRKLTADYTRELTDDEIVVTKNKSDLRIDVVYEARVPVVYNLDIVAKFEHHFVQEQ